MRDGIHNIWAMIVGGDRHQRDYGSWNAFHACLDLQAQKPKIVSNQKWEKSIVFDRDLPGNFIFRLCAGDAESLTVCRIMNLLANARNILSLKTKGITFRPCFTFDLLLPFGVVPLAGTIGVYNCTLIRHRKIFSRSFPEITSSTNHLNNFQVNQHNNF